MAPIVAILLNIFSPTTVFAAGVFLGGKWLGLGGLGVGEVLKEAAFGWDVWGMNTQVVVWCVWWPAWIVGGILVWGKPRDEKSERDVKKIASVKA